MFVPHGFTAQEVLDAGSRLPDPYSIEAKGRAGMTHHVAVHNYPGHWYREPDQGCASEYMRVLSFRLTNKLDIRTGQNVYAWELIGAR